MLLGEPLFILKSILGAIHLEMVSQCEALLLAFVFLRLLFFALHKGVTVRVFTSSILLLTNCAGLRGGLKGWVNDGSDFREQGWQAGPGMRILF